MRKAEELLVKMNNSLEEKRAFYIKGLISDREYAEALESILLDVPAFMRRPTEEEIKDDHVQGEVQDHNRDMHELGRRLGLA